MKTVVVTQPYVPTYRVPLFEAISANLAASGVRLLVLASNPQGAQALRGDQGGGEWLRELPEKSVRLGRRSVQWRRLPADLKRADLIVSELSVGNALGWQLVLSGRPVLLWGHGGSFVHSGSRAEEQLRSFMARRATAVMTYSDRGRENLVDHGVAPERVRAIGNSTDTRELLAARERALMNSASDATAGGLRDPAALFVGALDRPKRIDFLLSALEAAHHENPRFRATIVGRGEEGQRVFQFAESRPWCRALPEARGEQLAQLGATHDAVWMPGRVGLVALDALAMALPVFTTSEADHAPEIDFLSDGEVHFLANEPKDFALAALDVSSALPPPHLRKVRDDIPTIESVALNFANVVLESLTQ